MNRGKTMFFFLSRTISSSSHEYESIAVKQWEKWIYIIVASLPIAMIW